MKEVTEFERKYDAAWAYTLPDLTVDLSELSVHVQRSETVLLEATYFDTVDLGLLRSNMTLRRQNSGEDIGWTLKLSGSGPRARREIQLSLEEGRDERVPQELADLVFARTRGSLLEPIARLTTARTTTLIASGDGDSLVVIADDTVTSESLRDEVKRSWREIEVETMPKGHLLGRRIDLLLKSSGLNESQRSSKLASALGAGSPSRAAVENPHRGTAKIIWDRISTQIDELLTKDLEVRRDSQEAIHDMRVAARRLQHCLRTFPSMFDRSSYEVVAQELQWLARELGAVRDAEVLVSSVMGLIDGLGQGDSIQAVRQELHNLLQQSLVGAKADLAEALRSARYVHFVDRIVAFRDWTSLVHNDRNRRKYLFRQVGREVRRTVRMVERANENSGIQRDAILHEARKRAKGARYAAETVLPFWQKRALRLARSFEAIQQNLGNRHDSLVTKAFLEDSHLKVESPQGAYIIGVLVGREEATIAAIDRSFADLSGLQRVVRE